MVEKLGIDFGRAVDAGNGCLLFSGVDLGLDRVLGLHPQANACHGWMLYYAVLGNRRLQVPERAGASL